MITVENLKSFGADTEDALARCMNNEGFYLTLVGKVIEDKRLEQLEQQLAEKNLDAAFESAHALKGMYMNLSLRPLADPIIEMTELLRNRTDTDYSQLLATVKEQFARLKAL